MNTNWSNHQEANLALKPKWEITEITNRQNIMTSGQPFPKRWSLSNPTRTKSIIIKHKVKHHRNSDPQNRQQRTTSEPSH